jgi:hypothetical protein
MWKQYIKQALYQLKENRLISIVCMVGTALAICMIMVIVLTLQIRIKDCVPEVNRSRSLYVKAMTSRHKEQHNNAASSQMSVTTARECFKTLTIPEAVTITSVNNKMRASLPGGGRMSVDEMETDEAFWHVFSFEFLCGKPYTKADFDSGLSKAVVSASVARRLFGTTDVAGMTYFNDYTIMRPLVMDFTADANVNNIGDQFMFGSALMVAPVYEYGARSREVYFPASCGWYDFYSGKYVDGGQKLTVDAPYERIPLYVCEGAIVPYGPDMQYSDEKPASEITLYVYTGKDGAFTLYEDEGVNYNYEKGQYATIPFAYNDAEGTLVIGDRTGDFPGMLKERTFNVVKVSKDQPQPFDLKAKGTTVKYDGKAQTVKL